MKVVSVCHRSRVYRAVYQVSSKNNRLIRFVADLVPFIAKCCMVPGSRHSGGIWAIQTPSMGRNLLRSNSSASGRFAKVLSRVARRCSLPIYQLMRRIVAGVLVVACCDFTEVSQATYPKSSRRVAASGPGAVPWRVLARMLRSSSRSGVGMWNPVQTVSIGSGGCLGLGWESAQRIALKRNGTQRRASMLIIVSSSRREGPDVGLQAAVVGISKPPSRKQTEILRIGTTSPAPRIHGSGGWRRPPGQRAVSFSDCRRAVAPKPSAALSWRLKVARCIVNRRPLDQWCTTISNTVPSPFAPPPLVVP